MPGRHQAPRRDGKSASTTDTDTGIGGRAAEDTTPLIPRCPFTRVNGTMRQRCPEIADATWVAQWVTGQPEILCCQLHMRLMVQAYSDETKGIQE